MVLKHRQTEKQRQRKSPKLDEHYREIGIPAVRASVQYVLTDSSAVLTNTSDHKRHSRSIDGVRKNSRSVD
jgi:hypothetical protein